MTGEASPEDAGHELVDAASRGLLQTAFAFGAVNAFASFVMGFPEGATTITLVLGAIWLAAWSTAALRPDVVLPQLARRPVGIATAVAAAAFVSILLTGGYTSNIKTNANWIGWAVAVVAAPRVALGVGAMLSANLLVAFAACGMTADDLLRGPDRYMLVTDIANPMVIVLVALALSGVFRAIVGSLPAALESIRHGGHTSTPAMRALLDAPYRPRLPAAAGPSPESAPTARPASAPLSEIERELVELLAQGHTPQQIALISGQTNAAIYGRIKSAKAKVGAETIPHLIRLAWEVPR